MGIRSRSVAPAHTKRGPWSAKTTIGWDKLATVLLVCALHSISNDSLFCWQKPPANGGLVECLVRRSSLTVSPPLFLNSKLCFIECESHKRDADAIQRINADHKVSAFLTTLWRCRHSDRGCNWSCFGRVLWRSVADMRSDVHEEVSWPRSAERPFLTAILHLQTTPRAGSPRVAIPHGYGRQYHRRPNARARRWRHSHSQAVFALHARHRWRHALTMLRWFVPAKRRKRQIQNWVHSEDHERYSTQNDWHLPADTPLWISAIGVAAINWIT